MSMNDTDSPIFQPIEAEACVARLRDGRVHKGGRFKLTNTDQRQTNRGTTTLYM